MAKTIRQRTEEERDVPGGRRIRLHFSAGGEEVPAILLLPAAVPAPAALLLHGFTSRKEHMADVVGKALLARGVASLSVDLPLHGVRSDPMGAGWRGDPMAMMKHWRTARAEAELSVHYLAARPEVDRGRMGVVGYSLGSFLAVLTAARDRRIRAVVVAAGGDLPTHTPFGALARAVADPLAAVRRIRGTPILVTHGKNDRTVRPDQAERLYEAAGEPKEIRWWSSAHALPQAAIDHAAEWLRVRLGTDGGESA